MQLSKLLLLTAFAAPLASAQDGGEFVPSSVLSRIGDLLPEQNNAGAAFLSDVYTPNIEVSEPAEVRLVFLHEGAGYRNSLGYFTYSDNADGSVTIHDSQLVIPDASYGVVASGDYYHLRDEFGDVRLFQPGERIGFFLVANGWNSAASDIQNWDPMTPPLIPTADPQKNAGIGLGTYTSIRKINPEYGTGAVDEARHLAMIWFPAEPGFMGGEPYLVCGFEDLNRLKGSDDDFNDLVFVVSANPVEAIEETEAFVYSPGDADGDGVEGENDHYPNDPLRATVERQPALGEYVIGFEDQYPSLGDADYNDVVTAFHREATYAADGRLTDVQLTVHMVARGAGYDHELGWRFGVPEGATGDVLIERYASGGEVASEVESGRIENLVADGELRLACFPSTQAVLPPPPGGTFTNTLSETIDAPAASARVRITFDVPQDIDVNGLFVNQVVETVEDEQPVVTEELVEYVYPDLYLGVKHAGEVWDVHLPGYPGFADRPDHLPLEDLVLDDGAGSQTFYDDEGRPWALLVPFEWRFPLEHVRVWEAYPQFDLWVQQSGWLYADWYEHPTKASGKLGFELFDYVPTRDWSVALPKP